MRYKAFMSYSHETDRELAATLESALHRIGIPWYQRPQLHVFRDETILSTTVDLWKTIEGALNESEHLLLLASPQAAASPWVQEEITYWLQHRPLATLHIILTVGTIEWDDATADFDWEKTTALPPTLRRVFPEPPKYLDLRWAKGKRYLSPRNPEFLYAVAEVAAPLHNTTKDQIVWRERNQYRSTVILASAAAVLLLVLGLRAFWFQRVAEYNHQVALARQLMTQAETLRTQRPDQWQVSILLALEAVTRFPSPETDQALHHGSALLPCATARGGVTTLAFRPPEGKQIVTTGYNCLAYVWEVTTGTLIASLPHEQGIQTVAFSPDSVSLATLSYNSTVRLWDGHTYQRRVLAEQDTVEHENHISALTFSPDGRYLATASYENRTCLWHIMTGQKLRCFPPMTVELSLSRLVPVAVMSQQQAMTIRLACGMWNTAQIARMPHPSGVTTVLFSPDETHLATASYDPIVRLWEITRCQHPSCQEHLRLPHVGVVTALTFSQTGRYVATAGWDRVANVWDSITGQQLARFAHDDGVTSVAFDHLEHHLVTGSYDRTARIWDLKSRHEIARLPHDHGVTLVAFSPDDTRLATAGSDWVTRIWNPTTGQEVSRLPQEEGIAAVAFQADGQVLATASYGSTVHVWKRAEGQPLTLHHQGGVSVLTLSADGHTLATAGWDKSVRVWNLATGEIIAKVTQEHGIAALALNADGQTLAIAGWDGTVRVRNPQADTEIVSLTHVGGISALAVKDPYVLTAGWDHIVRVWNLVTGEERGHRSLPHGIMAVTFNGKGTQFATASDDNTVRVWDVVTAEEIVRFPLDASATAVAFSNTGNCLATASWNKTAQLWQLSPKQELTRFHHQEGIAQIAFSADGEQLITAGWDHVVLQWPWRREKLLSQVCTDLKSRSLTIALWKQYMGNEEPRDTCAALQTLMVAKQPPC